jgi:hypothetical protein
MSTPGQPGASSQPAAGWYPQLDGLNLPRALTNGVQQGFSLIYSLRDATSQLQTAVARTIQYGTRQARTQTNPQAVPDGALWFETDRMSVFYQSRLAANSTTRSWVYAGGFLIGSQPADLGKGDAGFLALVGNQFYRWDGVQWSSV